MGPWLNALDNLARNALYSRAFSGKPERRCAISECPGRASVIWQCVANAVVDAQSSVQKAAVLQKALH
jgi:hypothetical protein